MPPSHSPTHAITRQTIPRHLASTTSQTSTATTPTPPIILAAGLWRTGTSSLQSAFETQLNLAPCMHGSDVVTSIEKLKLFHRCCMEEEDEVRRELLRGWIGGGGWMALTDLPGWAFTEDLVVIYPTIRLLLNKRSNAISWLASVNTSLRFYSTTIYFLIGYFDPYLYWHHKMYVGLAHLLERRHGIKSMPEIFTTLMYEAHNEWVREVAARHGVPFLEYEVSEGWGPVVELLGVDVPREKDGSVVQFPRINEGGEMKELKAFLVRKGLKAWVRKVVGPALAGAVVIMGVYWKIWT